MLKISFLTCAIIAAQPLIEDARAGDAMSASLSVVWTGRFAVIAEAKAHDFGPQPSAPARHQRTDGNGDPDIVGSIPPDVASDTTKDIAMLRGAQALPLCALPGFAPDEAADGLACGGAGNNRWSAKAATFNYDLSGVKPDFANAIAPYGKGWDAAGTSPGEAPAR